MQVEILRNSSIRVTLGTNSRLKFLQQVNFNKRIGGKTKDVNHCVYIYISI